MERKDTSAVSRTYSLNPIVVTGSGHHQRLKSTATPVHVISSQEIREQGITTLDEALTRMMPQVSMAPNAMGSQLRLNGLGNKYILILVNGQKLSGDISNNIDLNRINMARVKRIEVLDGEVKAILHLFPASSSFGDAATIFGANWRRDDLKATSGDIDQHVSTLAAYAQQESSFRVGRGSVTATLGLRYTHHETFGNHLTPKASLMYGLGNLRLRATYSAGFRAPGLDELYYHYFSVNRGKAQVSFGNQGLKPEKSHYFSLGAEYRTDVVAVSLTGYLNRINDMVVKQNIPVDAASLAMLRQEFPEMTDDQAAKLVQYALYQNSDKGDVKGVQLNVSANLFRGFNLSANYAYTYARTLSSEATGRPGSAASATPPPSPPTTTTHGAATP